MVAPHEESIVKDPNAEVQTVVEAGDEALPTAQSEVQPQAD